MKTLITICLMINAVVLFGQEKPKLHLLSIGPVFQDVKYTSNDAVDFINVFENKTPLFKSTNSQLLADSNATIEQIRTAIQILQENYKTTQIEAQDMLILFISSHGIISETTQEFCIKSYYQNDTDENEMITLREILDGLNTINCKKILFIDACYSGSFSIDGSYEAEPQVIAEALKVLMKEQNGWTIFTSSNDEPSWEHAAWENGAFTEALIEGIQQHKADYNRNKIITINELYQYLKVRIPELNKNIGFPKQYPQLKNELGDLPIYAY
jgi:hypothetical protein